MRMVSQIRMSVLQLSLYSESFNEIFKSPIRNAQS